MTARSEIIILNYLIRYTLIIWLPLQFVNSGKIQQKTEKFQKPISTVPKKSPEIHKFVSVKTNGSIESDTVTSVPSKIITTDAVLSSKVSRKMYCSNGQIVLNFVHIFSL